MTRRVIHEATCLMMAGLATESQHGSAIMAHVLDSSGGRIRLRAGTLFAVLDKLRTDGLVRIDRDEVVGGRIRRYYRLSSVISGPSAEPPGPAARPHLRVGDAERDAATAALGEHFARGRLTVAELHDRLDLAVAAVTERDISRAIDDLPGEFAWPEGGGGDGALDHSARQDAEAP